MKIIPVKTQLTCDKQPRVYWAVLFPDVFGPDDLVTYRNALTNAAKTLLLSDEAADEMNDVVFSLIQMSEFIADGIDDFHEKGTTWEQFARSQVALVAASIREAKMKGGSNEAA